MVESQYWKEELARIAKTLEPVENPPERTERAHCTVERDLCVGFFIVRRMIELYKVSSITRTFQMKVYYSKCVTDLLPIVPCAMDDGVYDFDGERSVVKTPKDIANQFIHSCLSLVLQDETRNWAEVFTVSNKDRHKHVWRIPIAKVVRLFEQAAKDYPLRVSFARTASGGAEITTN